VSPTDPFEVLTAEHALVRDQLGRALHACETPSSRSCGRSVHALADGLRLHVHREESALFPVCEELFGGKDSAVAVLRADHAELEQAAASLAAHADETKPEETRRRLQELLRRLVDHFAREEHVLFPLAAMRMSRAQAAFVTRRLRRGPTP